MIFLGETEIGAGLASALNATTPIWTVIVAHCATVDEKPGRAKIARCLVGLASTVVLVGARVPWMLLARRSGHH